MSRPRFGGQTWADTIPSDPYLQYPPLSAPLRKVPHLHPRLRLRLRLRVLQELLRLEGLLEVERLG